MSDEDDGVAFSVDLESGKAERLPQITLQSIGMKERSDLQRWVLEFPELVEAGLLLITSEFDQWEIREKKVPDRLDALFLDGDGHPVIAELKRDRAADTTDLQALKYAAYCSKLTVDDVCEQYANFHGKTVDEARQFVVDHAPSLEDGELGRARIWLVAGDFGPAVTSVVLWLREYDVDIGCIQVTARHRTGDSTAVLLSRQLLPPPKAEDYLVRRRRRDQEEEMKKATSGRRANSVKVLAEAGVLKEGDKLTLGVETLTAKWRPAVESLLEQHPEARHADWTGEPVSKSLRWHHDGAVYSPTGLTKQLLALAGFEVDAIPGPDYWLLPDGRPMYRASLEVDARDAEVGKAADRMRPLVGQVEIEDVSAKLRQDREP